MVEVEGAGSGDMGEVSQDILDLGTGGTSTAPDTDFMAPDGGAMDRIGDHIGVAITRTLIMEAIPIPGTVTVT